MQNKEVFSFNSNGTTGEALNAPKVEHAVNYPNTPINPSTLNLLDKVANFYNLKRAFKQVKRKKGSPGIDKLSVDFINANLDSILSKISDKLLDGSFKPTPVKRVAIPKPNGKTRNLGIPIVIDRIVQQAICQIIEPFFDHKFSKYSFGFRKHKSTKDAVNQAQAFIADGFKVFISIDLKQCFDMINHDLLFNQIRKVISDKRILKFIGRFLRAGIFDKGIILPSRIGTPQGGNLSPLLTNIFLDQIDKNLENRGLRFVRYADDITIFVKSPRAAERVFAKTVLFIEEVLKLPVNQTKSKISSNYADILGFLVRCDNSVFIPSSKIKTLKSKIRNLTRRSNGKSIPYTIFKLNQVLRGWFHYFKLAQAKRTFRELDSWIRRRLSAKLLKHFKKKKSIFKRLARRIHPALARSVAFSHKGIWRLSHTFGMGCAFKVRFFVKALGLFCLSDYYNKFLKSVTSGTAVYGPVRTVV